MDYDKVKKVLREARAMIATPDQWSKGADRRTEGGKILACSDCKSLVASRCAGGAILDSTCAGDVPYRQAESFLMDAIERKAGERYQYLAPWNDSPERTHAEVLQAFDWAIAASTAADDSAA